MREEGKYYGRLPREMRSDGSLNERESGKEEEEGTPGRGKCKGGQSHKSSQEKMQRLTSSMVA